MRNWLHNKLGLTDLDSVLAEHHRVATVATEQWKYVLGRLSEIDNHLLKLQNALEATSHQEVMTLQPAEESTCLPVRDTGEKTPRLQRNREKTTQRHVMTYLQTRKGQSVHYTEVMKALNYTKGQASSALSEMARHGIVTRTGRGTYVLVYVNSKVQEHILGHLRQSREPVVTSVELSRQLGWTQAQITTALSSMISRGEVVRLKPRVYALPLASKEDVSHDPQ